MKAGPAVQRRLTSSKSIPNSLRHWRWIRELPPGRLWPGVVVYRTWRQSDAECPAQSQAGSRTRLPLTAVSICERPEDVSDGVVWRWLSWPLCCRWRMRGDRSTSGELWWRWWRSWLRFCWKFRQEDQRWIEYCFISTKPTCPRTSRQEDIKTFSMKTARNYTYKYKEEAPKIAMNKDFN